MGEAKGDMNEGGCLPIIRRGTGYRHALASFSIFF